MTMPTVFIMINAEAGSEQQLFDKLKKLPVVKEIHRLYGIYDIMIRVDAQSIEALKQQVTPKIRSMEEVRSTLTMIAFESYP